VINVRHITLNNGYEKYVETKISFRSGTL